MANIEVLRRVQASMAVYCVSSHQRTDREMAERRIARTERRCQELGAREVGRLYLDAADIAQDCIVARMPGEFAHRARWEIRYGR